PSAWEVLFCTSRRRHTRSDRDWSSDVCSSDLEVLRSYYQNRGYLEFNIESTQVSITPDRENIFITLNVTEGPLFTVGDVKIAGRSEERRVGKECRLKKRSSAGSRVALFEQRRH